MVPLLVGTTLFIAGAQTVQRSLDEFLAAQGTFCFPDGAGGCLLFAAPLPNQIGVSDPEQFRCAYVDATGIANEAIEAQSGGRISLGTTVTGSVKEQALQDGTAKITVKLKTSNALIFAVSGCDFANGPMLFGQRGQEVLAGATPALGDVTLTVTHLLPTPGAPLLDLVQAFQFPDVDEDILQIKIDGGASGELRAAFGVPDGTPGRIDIRSRIKLDKKNGAMIVEDIELSVD